MTIQALAHAIVETVLDSLDRHVFAAIPATEIQDACNAVAQLIRQESAPGSWSRAGACVDPEDETP